jgi:antitoxin component YwqK of YwqJK toxin-antitoxin module
MAVKQINNQPIFRTTNLVLSKAWNGELGMPAKGSNSQSHTEYHKDGSILARGRMVDGVPMGYWEWFRMDGTIMRSGNFQDGEPIGDWITYDQKGNVYKITKKKLRMK